MIVNNNAGLWELKIEIGNYVEDPSVKKEDLWLLFRGCTKAEWIKLRTMESEIAVEPEEGVKIEVEDEKGRERERIFAPDAMEKRFTYLDKLVFTCLKDHNFEKDENKKMSKEEVWDWVSARPNLFEFIISTWRDKHPFHKTEKEQK